jgi:hypothetical protein
VDANGQSFVPPLGNGIQVAYEAHSAKDGAAASSGATAESEPQETEPSAAQRLADEHRTTGDDEKDLVKGMEATSLGANGEIGGPAASTVEGEGEREVPAVVTKPGEPVGDVVFDHPPTDSEVKEALKH